MKRVFNNLFTHPQTLRIVSVRKYDDHTLIKFSNEETTLAGHGFGESKSDVVADRILHKDKRGEKRRRDLAKALGVPLDSILASCDHWQFAGWNDVEPDELNADKLEGRMLRATLQHGLNDELQIREYCAL